MKTGMAQIHENSLNKSSRISFSFFAKKEKFKKAKKWKRCQLSIIHVFFKPTSKLCIKSGFFIIKSKSFFLLPNLYQSALNLIVNCINLFSITRNVKYFFHRA